MCLIATTLLVNTLEPLKLIYQRGGLLHFYFYTARYKQSLHQGGEVLEAYSSASTRLSATCLHKVFFPLYVANIS